MRAAWKIREARYHTGHIEFQNIENYPYLPPEKRRPLDAKIVDTVTLKHQVIFDAKRLRYSREGMLDHAAGGIKNWFKVKFVTTDDSEFVSELTKYFNVGFYSHGSVGKGHAYGKEHTYLADSWDYHSSPIFMAFRPLTKSMQNFDLEKMGKPVRKTLEDGRKVVVFKKGIREYSFDPEREYVLLRQEYHGEPRENQDTLLRLDIQYRTDSRWGAVPKIWKFMEVVEKPEDRVVMRILGRVTKMEFNRQVADDDFQIVFPPRTVVNDGRSKVKFLIQDDGTSRIIKKGTKAPHVGPGFPAPGFF